MAFFMTGFERHLCAAGHRAAQLLGLPIIWTVSDII
jgi:hypothetical protein